MRQNQTAELSEWKLKEARQIRQYQDQGHLVIATSRELPVLCLYDIPQVEYADGGYQCPWGTIEELGYRYYTLHLNGHDRTELPVQITRWLKPLEMATVTVDATRRLATVRTGEGTEVLLTDVPTWESPWSLLDTINRTLREQGLAIVCQRLEMEMDEDAENDGNLWPPGMVPIARNGHTAVYLTGYAHDNGLLVYLGAVGHKTSLKSIWASVTNSGKKKDRLYLSPGTVPISRLNEYHSPLWAPLPDQNAYHLVLLSRAATEANVQDDVCITYLLAWDGDDDPQAAVKRLLVERLNAALPIPVLPQWADALWDAAASRRRWLAEIATGGDCRAGYRLTINVNLWIGVIQAMMTEETLAL